LPRAPSSTPRASAACRRTPTARSSRRGTA
jgi:hypothetical protein